MGMLVEKGELVLMWFEEKVFVRFFGWCMSEKGSVWVRRLAVLFWPVVYVTSVIVCGLIDGRFVSVKRFNKFLRGDDWWKK